MGAVDQVRSHDLAILADLDHPHLHRQNSRYDCEPDVRLLHRSARLLQNAEAALISSIEIYNKPTFAIAKRLFSILAITAWELLRRSFSALMGITPTMSVRLFFPKTKLGKPSKKQQLKRNRSKTS